MFEYLGRKINQHPDDLRLFAVVILHTLISPIFRFVLSKKVFPSLGERMALIRETFAAGLMLLSAAYLYGIAKTLALVVVLSIIYQFSFACVSPKSAMAYSIMIFFGLIFMKVYSLFTDDINDAVSIGHLCMMIVPKVTYFFWHIFYVQSGTEGPLQTREVPQYVKDFEKDLMKKIPSRTDFILYCLNFIGNLASPIYSYTDHKGFALEIHPREESVARRVGVKVGLFFCALSVVSFLGGALGIEVANSLSFSQQNIFVKIFFFLCEGTKFRAKYYNVFLLGEVMAIFGNLRSSSSLYSDYALSCKVIEIEKSFCLKQRIEIWNISIANWLRDCYFDKLTFYFSMNKDMVSMIVFAISAFWHGLSISYYFVFLGVYVLMISERIMFRNPFVRDNLMPNFFIRLGLEFVISFFYMNSISKIIHRMKMNPFFAILPLTIYAYAKGSVFLAHKLKLGQKKLK